MSNNPILPVNPMAGAAPPPVAIGVGRLKPVDPMRVLRTYLWWLIGAGFVGLLLGTLVWGVLRYTMPRYTSMAYLQVNPALVDLQSVSGGNYNARMEALEATILNEVARLTSQDILRKALDRQEIRSTTWFAQFDGDPTEARESLEEDVLRAKPQRGSTLIRVAASTRDKTDAPKIISAVIGVYLLELSLDSTGDTGAKRDTYMKERNRLDNEISGLNTKLERFAQKNKITSMDSRVNEATRLYDTYVQQMAQLQLDLDSVAELQKMLVDYQQQGDTEPSSEDLAVVNAMFEVTELQRRLNSYRENRTHAATLYAENHPEVHRWQSRIDALEIEASTQRQIKLREVQTMRLDQATNAMTSLQGRILALQPKIDDVRIDLIDLTEKMTKFHQIQQDLDQANVLMAEVQSFLGQLRIFETHPDASRVKQLPGITEPELTFPKFEIVIPGVAFLVLALTVGIVFLIEMLDQRVKAPSDVKLLKEVELLGTLPDVAEDPSGPTEIERVVEKYPAGLMAESFRQVRTAILDPMDRRGYRTLMLVAAQPRSGTSCVTQNLAASLAFHGRNVVIVDANFRRPAQHQLFDLDNSSGLVDVLRTQKNIHEVLHKIEGINISVVTSGHAEAAPSELLEGEGLRDVIRELETKFDIVLIDAPPALLASDSQLLAKHIDAIACVVRATADKRGMIDRMVGQLSTQRADMLGLILNGVQSAVGGYFRKSYQEFYRYRENPNASATHSNGSNGQTPGRERSAGLTADADEPR